jgi:hypothetical protein
VGRIIEGMARIGFDIQLTRSSESGWPATFDAAFREQSPTHAASSAWQSTPWRGGAGRARS